ncbi:CAAX protease self-immunity [Aquimarina amphilecti]|uniref:CAAX protease self-immunity n=1 Tax=Aquimarina amphilecti TaxID=1038014 RepID=A0A1H7JPL5_AQUAM|nr:type II CAAX endopeptidase family protein [Aquimarina amphilecti]SEK76559.1 CAAX protease self-immunity [Aquimarina amphilecti]
MIKLEKNVWYYIGLVFLFTYTIQIISILIADENAFLAQFFVGFTMFIPGIAAIVYLIKTKQGLKYINWDIGKIKYIVFSLILPILITFLGILVFEHTGLASNNVFLINNAQVHSIEIPLIFGSNQQSILFFILNFFVTGILFSLLTSFLTIGEEIGWRGFLQKKLLEKNSLFKSLTFLGILWGFWHFPLIINGFNYPEYPMLGAFLFFPLTIVFVSYFIGWLTINSKSVWPAVLAHGVINSFMILLFEMDFGKNKLEGNLSILGLWLIIGTISFYLLSKKTIN